MSDEIKPANPAQELVQWQEDYNARVEAERRVEADRALKGRERVNKALAMEDSTLDMMRFAASQQVSAAGFAASLEQRFAQDLHRQWDQLSVADKKTALRLLARTGTKAIDLANAAVKLERTRQKTPLRAPATAETITADPAKGLELLEGAVDYLDKLRGLEPTKIVSDELMAEIEAEDSEDD
jgi:hypothetical protein